MEIPIAQVAINTEQDTITARKLAQHVAELAGFAAQDRTKIATAVSEIARNAVTYADGGRAACSILTRDRKQYLQFVLRDQGPGIADLDEVLEGSYRSRTGMGVGIAGSRKLMDLFAVETAADSGTVVTMAKELPRSGGRITASQVEEWTHLLTVEPAPAAVEEARRSSLDMMRSLNVLKHKEASLTQQLSETERLNQELKAAQRKLVEQATVDPLTELPNRRVVLDELAKELARTARMGQPLSVAIADLDHFKKLNDTRGHLAGDNALREAARRMRLSLRVYDTIGRYGGEEFLLVLPGCDGQAAVALAERIRHSVGAEPMRVDEGVAQVTCSIGVATAQAAADPEILIDTADAALYRAKQGGRDRVELATERDAEQAVATHRERAAAQDGR